MNEKDEKVRDNIRESVILMVFILAVAMFILSAYFIKRENKIKEELEIETRVSILDTNYQYDKFIKCEDTLEDYVLNEIKRHEGYRENIYLCLGGHKTIGFGHLIQPTDTFQKVSLEQAEELLKLDFTLSKEAAIRLSPILEADSNIYKFYSIAHFIYSKGSGNYSRSKLRYLVNSQQPIDEEIMKWNKVRINGKFKEIDYLNRINKWRLTLYNTKYENRRK